MNNLSEKQKRQKRGLISMLFLSLLFTVVFYFKSNKTEDVTFGFVLGEEWKLINEWKIASKSGALIFLLVAFLGVAISYLLFRKNKNQNEEQLDNEKQLFERELALYRKEKYQQLNEDIENELNKIQLEIGEAPSLEDVQKTLVILKQHATEITEELGRIKERIDNNDINGSLVADLHFDHEDEWERLFAKAALRGIPVYHYRQIMELETGQVRIDRLSENVLGITPLEPGFKRVRIVPQLGRLHWAEGAYPTPLGPINVRHERQADGTVKSKIDAPAGIEHIRWMEAILHHPIPVCS